MVEKGLERESDDVIVGVKTEGLKRFIVRVVMYEFGIIQWHNPFFRNDSTKA